MRCAMPDSVLKLQLPGFVAREFTAMFAGTRWIIRPRALDSVGSRKYTEAYNARVAHCAMISRARVQKAI